MLMNMTDYIDDSLMVGYSIPNFLFMVNLGVHFFIFTFTISNVFHVTYMDNIAVKLFTNVYNINAS